MCSAQAEEIKEYEIKIKYYTCVGCGDCMTACPVNQENREENGFLNETNAVILVKNSNVRVVNERLCTGCGSCIPACPVKAIDIKMKVE